MTGFLSGTSGSFETRSPDTDDISWDIRPGEHGPCSAQTGRARPPFFSLWRDTSGRPPAPSPFWENVSAKQTSESCERKSAGSASFLQASVPPSQKPLVFIVSGKYASLGILKNRMNPITWKRENLPPRSSAAIYSTSLTRALTGRKATPPDRGALIHSLDC